MNSTVKTVVFWLVIVLSGVLLWQVVKGANSGAQGTRSYIFSNFSPMWMRATSAK